MFVTSVLVLVAVSVLIAAYALESRRIAEKQNRFKLRKNKSLNEIYSEYFCEQQIDRERFERLWLQVSKVLRLDPLKLLPTDRFDVELAPVKGFLTEDELADLEDLYKENVRNQRGVEPVKVPETLGDLVLILKTRSP
jgi:hypothetical protein